MSTDHAGDGVLMMNLPTPNDTLKAIAEAILAAQTDPAIRAALKQLDPTILAMAKLLADAKSKHDGENPPGCLEIATGNFDPVFVKVGNCKISAGDQHWQVQEDGGSFCASAYTFGGAYRLALLESSRA